MDTEITIRKLDPSETGLIRKIAKWYFDEWDTPIEKTIRRLASQPGDDVLFQLIMILGNEMVATGGLCHEVNLLKVHPQFNHLKPWVALLYTEKGFRNRGLGKRLLEEIECCAGEMGLSRIFLYTFTAESLYRRCGWRQIGRAPYKGQDTVVMERILNENL